MGHDVRKSERQEGMTQGVNLDAEDQEIVRRQPLNNLPKVVLAHGEFKQLESSTAVDVSWPKKTL